MYENTSTEPLVEFNGLSMTINSLNKVLELKLAQLKTTQFVFYNVYNKR